MSSPASSSEKELQLVIEREQRAAIERISNSEWFVGAPKRIALLRYLFEHRTAAVGEWDIAKDVFNEPAKAGYRSGKVRGQCKKLRAALERFADADISPNQWRVFLPLVIGNEGYSLKMVNLSAPESMVHAFWQAHMEPPRPVDIICNEPLFYRDFEASMVVRVPHMMDTSEDDNAPKTPTGPVAAVLSNEFNKPLYPCHLYALSGEIGARDQIAEWFADAAGIKTKTRFSRRIDDVSAEIKTASLILLGNIHTNRLIEDITTVYQYGQFAYRLNGAGFATVEVRNPTPFERAALKKYLPANADPASPTIVLRDDPQPDRVVFCVVTRLPNPYSSEGAITILGACYTRALEEIAFTLTDENSVAELLEKTKWPKEQKVPRYFEGLFSVRLGRVGVDAEMATPKLRCWRDFDKYPG